MSAPEAVEWDVARNITSVLPPFKMKREKIERVHKGQVLRRRDFQWPPLPIKCM